MKRNCIQAGCMAFATSLLLVIFCTVDRKKEYRTKKETIIPCGQVQPANAHNTWPKDDNSGSGCTHQTVVAALLGRVKREKPHGC